MATTVRLPDAHPGPTEERPGTSIAPLVVWTALVLVAVAWGSRSIAHRAGVAVGAAPLVGQWDLHLSWRLAPAVGVAVAVVIGTGAARRWRWPIVVFATGAASAAWTLALAASDGWSRVTAPLGTRYELVPFAGGIDDPHRFLQTFVERLPTYPTHVKGHPPGAPLVFWALDRVGLPGTGWATALVLTSVAITAMAVVVVAAEVAGRPGARAAAPFVVLLPAAVWAGTSPDPVYGAAFALGTAAIVLATRPDRGAPGWAVLGGVLLAVALHLSYGLVPLLGVPLAVVVTRRAWPVLAPAAAGGLLVVLGFGLAGFWWPSGLAATHHAYTVGVASRRPYGYFAFVGNPAALALAAGPAVAVALVRCRRTAIAIVVGAALVAAAAADVSGLSKGEVERIWLPFVPWLALATGAYAGRRRGPWLVAQAATGVALQAALRSPW